MERQLAVKITREELDKYGLKSWGIRLSTNPESYFLGLCDYKSQTIILSAHHIDIHPELSVINTIKHEIAHALTPHHGHDEVWANRARELGCDNTLACSNLSLSPDIIDAIRSGHLVEMEIEEHVIRTPKYKVTRLQDKCPTCGKVAVEKFSNTLTHKDGSSTTLITLECFHIIKKFIQAPTPFHLLVSNEWKDTVRECKHEWNKTICTKCNEFKLYPFQVIGARQAEIGLSTQKGFGIFDDMGLGKTIQALALIKYHKELLPCIIVPKSALTFQWFTQAIKWLGPEYTPQILRSSRDLVLPGFKIYIVSYDLLKRVNKQDGIGVRAQLEKLNYKLVILDECQQIKNVDSARTQEVRRLVSNPNVKVLPLSGTPWKNRGSEFFPVLNMLSPTKFDSESKFKLRWCEFYETDDGKSKMGGIANIPLFREYTEGLMIRREYNEVMDEFPEINRYKLNVQLDEMNQESFDHAESEFVEWYNDYVIGGEEDSINSIEILGRMARMRHIVGLAKIPATVAFVEEFLENTNRKLVIFTQHIDVRELMYDKLRQVCREYGVPVIQMTAEQDDRERYEIEKRFNSTDRIIMLASTAACGEGRNFQTCSDAVMHERQFNPQNEEQASPGRFRRIGQKSSHINTTYPEAEGTIDAWLDDINENKGYFYNKSMNKGDYKGWSEGNFAKDLATKIVERHNKKNKGIKKKVSQFARL